MAEPACLLYHSTNEFKPGRKTLVFVHGLSGSSSAWKPYWDKWQDSYNLLSMDLRGHGFSGKPNGYGSYRLDLFAADIDRLIKESGLRDFVLISHSFGTLIALDYLEKYRPDIQGLVLLSPNIEVRKRRLARMIHPFLKMSRLLDLYPSPMPSGAHVDYSGYINTGDWNIRRMIADIKATSLRVYLYASAHAYSFSAENFAGSISAPTLIMHGRKDTIFPVENSLLLAEKIRNSQLKIIENADHILVLNYFQEVSEEIENFLRQL